MSKPTPTDYIVQRAHQWYESGSAVIGAPEGKKDAAKRAHHMDIRKLRTAVEMDKRATATPGNGSGEP